MNPASVLVLTLLALPLATSSAGDGGTPADITTVREVRGVVARYFRAMRAGDCRRMQRDLTEAVFTAQHGTLCNENREYPRFLREQHRHITIRLDEVMQHDPSSVTCTITVLKAGNPVDRVRWRLDRVGGEWKIAQMLP